MMAKSLGVKSHSDAGVQHVESEISSSFTGHFLGFDYFIVNIM